MTLPSAEVCSTKQGDDSKYMDTALQDDTSTRSSCDCELHDGRHEHAAEMNNASDTAIVDEGPGHALDGTGASHDSPSAESEKLQSQSWGLKQYLEFADPYEAFTARSASFADQAAEDGTGEADDMADDDETEDGHEAENDDEETCA